MGSIATRMATKLKTIIGVEHASALVQTTIGWPQAQHGEEIPGELSGFRQPKEDKQTATTQMYLMQDKHHISTINNNTIDANATKVTKWARFKEWDGRWGLATWGDSMEALDGVG